MFLASERKQAVIQMANVKLQNTTDELPLKVFKVLTDLDKDGYLQQLTLTGVRPKMNGHSAAEILASSTKESLGTETQISEALEFLHADQAGLITKVGIVAQQGKYAINWRSAFVSMQMMLIDRYVESTYGKH